MLVGSFGGCVQDGWGQRARLEGKREVERRETRDCFLQGLERSLPGGRYNQAYLSKDRVSSIYRVHLLVVNERICETAEERHFVVVEGVHCPNGEYTVFSTRH